MQHSSAVFYEFDVDLNMKILYGKKFHILIPFHVKFFINIPFKKNIVKMKTVFSGHLVYLCVL